MALWMWIRNSTTFTHRKSMLTRCNKSIREGEFFRLFVVGRAHWLSASFHCPNEFLCCRFIIGCVTAPPSFARFTEKHRCRRCPPPSVGRNFLPSAKRVDQAYWFLIPCKAEKCSCVTASKTWDQHVVRELQTCIVFKMVSFFLIFTTMPQVQIEPGPLGEQGRRRRVKLQGISWDLARSFQCNQLT